MGRLDAATRAMETAHRLRDVLPPEHPERREADLLSANVRFAVAARDGDAQDAEEILGTLDDQEDARELRTQIQAWLAENEN